MFGRRSLRGIRAVASGEWPFVPQGKRVASERRSEIVTSDELRRRTSTAEVALVWGRGARWSLVILSDYCEISDRDGGVTSTTLYSKGTSNRSDGGSTRMSFVRRTVSSPVRGSVCFSSMLM